MVKHLPAVWDTQVRSPGQEDSLEKEVATHSSTLAWKIPWMEEPGELQSMGVTKSWTQLSDFTFMHWRRKWQPTSVFLPGESQGWGACGKITNNGQAHLSVRTGKSLKRGRQLGWGMLMLGKGGPEES
ncbi:unnamed protein product [Rangifer tarandus platyrhynchus]|uniref:Uncharacterized protein n=1 Tax=Rangifer tarandus platyrhynchus TaxID=3082113 RepID=A0ABN8YPL2_RANTA|nr:unnamed protein product [Rangifer tarandus platyrhynchus]